MSKFLPSKLVNKIYQMDIASLVTSAFQGTKSTCFAYGQTGSGKTYTMMGNQSSKGLYKLAVDDLFAFKQPNHSILVSFYEIYCSQLFDLLNSRNKLVLREDGNATVNVVGLLEVEVENPDELFQCVEAGDEQRMTSATMANYDSSRSHAILQMRIIETGGRDVGRVSFIDLAGNERGADTYDNDKQTRLDGAEINKSLLALKECIRALDQDKKHTPFRGSKLTLVLKDSFIGNCKTVMIANVAPTNSCCELSLNTLRYADRVKELSSSSKKDAKPLSVQEQLSNKLMLPRGHYQQSARGTNLANPSNNSNVTEEMPMELKVHAQRNNPPASNSSKVLAAKSKLEPQKSDPARTFFGKDAQAKAGKANTSFAGQQVGKGRGPTSQDQEEPAQYKVRQSSSRSVSMQKSFRKSVSVNKQRQERKMIRNRQEASQRPFGLQPFAKIGSPWQSERRACEALYAAKTGRQVKGSATPFQKRNVAASAARRQAVGVLTCEKVLHERFKKLHK